MFWPRCGVPVRRRSNDCDRIPISAQPASPWILCRLGGRHRTQLAASGSASLGTRGGDSVERHINSTQYLLALDGPVETHVQTADGWRVDRYGQGDSALLQDRWHVVPSGIWHRTVAPDASYWGIVAFHSAREVSDEYR